MKVTLFGCGGWGSRVAAKLAQREDVRLVVVDADLHRARELATRLACDWSGDPYGYLGVTGTSDGTLAGGMVVIATPPSERLPLVRAILSGYGAKPVAIRVEKPLAQTAIEADEIVAACDAAGVALSVGFTLLHHPLYAAAFAYMRATQATPIHVDAVRIGAPARHAENAFIDAGIHAAAVAAYLRVPAGIAAAYDTDVMQRATRIYTSGGRILVDEIAGVVTTAHGEIGVRDGDALEREIDAWFAGEHRGTPDVAVEAQRIIDTHVECGVAA